jgi:DNA-binding LytR/AlgR family response regulator
MAIKCLAVDDEPLALKQIGAYIKKTPFLELVSLCRNAFDAIEFIGANHTDLLFVDINMPDLTGIDFVKSLTEKPLIIFTTAHSEFAIEGFKIDAIDYLLKPIGYNDFLRAVNKVKTHYDLISHQNDPVKATPHHLFVKSEYRLIRIELSDIKYIESMHEYVKIHLASGKPIMTLASMKSIEEHLPGKFLRVHRSYIVNTQRIKVIERNRIIFEDNVYIPVSSQYKSKFQDFINKSFLF